MDVYRVKMWQTPDGIDRCQWSDIVVSKRTGALCAMARRVIALDGAADLPVEVVGSSGAVRLRAKSVFALAGMDVSEGDGDSPRFVRWTYRPNPHAKVLR